MVKEKLSEFQARMEPHRYESRVKPEAGIPASFFGTHELDERLRLSDPDSAHLICRQAKEWAMDRVLNECDPEGSGINLSLLEHIRLIEWDNVILYGEYVLNQDLIL